MGGWGKKKSNNTMPFFKMTQTSSNFVEALQCVRLRELSPICTFPLSNETVLRKTVLKTERKKGQQKHPVTAKDFQRSYVRNVIAGAFHGGKMQSFALVVPAPGPAETQGDQKLLPQGWGSTESYEWCPSLTERLFCQVQNHLLPTFCTGCHARCF